MAISGSTHRADDDPVLSRLVATNTFESDWPTLRQHLHVALLSSLPLFLSRGPPRPYRPPQSPTIIGPEPIKVESSPNSEERGTDEKVPSESLLLSPSTGTAGEKNDNTSTPQNASTRIQVDATPRSLEAEPTATPASNRLESLHTEDDLLPSTQGGLVIAPFPPLDPDRRRRSSFEAGPSTTIPTVIGPGPRINGLRSQRPLQLGPAVVDEAYDEDVVIGGKMLPSWLDEQEGKKEIERVAKVLDELDAPPFTIQRLAELLSEPTQYHTTLGKFLRAVEKTLLVTTPWEPPSYTPTPASLLPNRISSVSGGSTISGSSDNGYDSDSTMPPGSTTPMFSPIPFLTHQESDELGLTLDGLANGTNSGRSLDDGLMSPLMLNDNSGVFGSAANPRSPTPEPEDAEGEGEAEASADASGAKTVHGHQDDGDTEMSSSTGNDAINIDQPDADNDNDALPPRPSAAQGQYESIEHSDPAHQSYLGRVDELDTGPILATSSANSDPSSSSSPPADGHLHKKRSDEVVPLPGTGEGGNLTPHGMSDKPVPISSTTVVKDEMGDRSIAGLPRTTSEKTLSERFVSAGGERDRGTESKSPKGGENGDSQSDIDSTK
ncbi:hypothetical protein I316_01888 [Kwoniella heveanensis BCC8398]|uniref:Uncharacterized protein n=1 Tax=Kwoniella heveanensis BCC8398 TaxID=1296120 RepID=A0A1B9H035_9TREE|nr:hypothetical protein I316_01888 [Kwoniella heveanensis BCC8398]